MYLVIGIVALIYGVIKGNEFMIIAASIFAIADSIDSLRRELKKHPVEQPDEHEEIDYDIYDYDGEEDYY